MLDSKGEGVTAQSLQNQINLNGVKATAKETDGSIKVTFATTGNNYWVDGNGNIVDTEPFTIEKLEIGEAVNADKYGWKVTNYTKKAIGPDGTNENSGEWRLFFQDDNYTYIITDDCMGGIYTPNDYYGSYANGASVSTVGQRLSPKISSLFTESNTNSNIKATAWFTDTEVWKEYKSEDALFAIGSPTAELFAASYNSTEKSNTIELGLGTYGYTENTDMDWLLTSDNHGIYNKSTYSSWWLASPYDYEPGWKALFVESYSGCIAENIVDGWDAYPCGIRPIVCIQTSVFNEKYKLADE